MVLVPYVFVINFSFRQIIFQSKIRLPLFIYMFIFRYLTPHPKDFLSSDLRLGVIRFKSHNLCERSLWF